MSQSSKATMVTVKILSVDAECPHCGNDQHVDASEFEAEQFRALEDCDWCNGTGKIIGNYNEPVSCCGQHMSLGIAHKIADLPDLKVGFEKGIYVFKFNGGEGVLMPLNV